MMRAQSALNFIMFQKKTDIFKKGFDMKKAVKKIIDVFVFLFGIGGKIRDDAVDNGLCDFSGQGRDEYGR